MVRRSGRRGSSRHKLGAVAALAAVTIGPPAQAQELISTLFGGFATSRPQTTTMTPLPYASWNGTSLPEGEALQRQRPLYPYSGGSHAYCVRTCDGRYFPITSGGNQTKAASCNSFCPSSETKVVYGGNIDNAFTDNGKRYSDLPNAYRYRDELVAGCTCNGKDPTGLAAVAIQDDPTLRKGDIVAGRDALMVAGRGADRRGASLQLSPAPESVRSRYRRVPVVAAQ
jgi:Protein of unknown function (DUF2865)